MAVLPIIKQDLPSWATFSKDSIYPDFYKRAGYPTNIIVPNNKFIIFEHDVLLDIEPRVVGAVLKNPIPFYGFVIDNKTNSVEGRIDINDEPVHEDFEYWNKERVGGLVGDSYWCNIADGDDYTQWFSDDLIDIAANQTFMALDLEHHQWNEWNSNHWDKMAEIIDEVRTACPWVKIGGWARHDVTIGPFFDPENGGVENESGFNFYANMYVNGPALNISGFYQTGMNCAFPFGYMKGRQSAQLMYNLMHTVEVSKAYNPTVLQIPTVWVEIEKVADYEGDDQDTVLWHNRTDKVITSDEKLHTPPDVMFAYSLLGLTVWDGVYWFGTGANYSDNINFADDIGIQPDVNQNSIYTTTVRGKEFRVSYRWQYKGFINYNAIANYMCGLDPFKSIIEASTPWIIPEYKNNLAYSWQTGLKKYPSWAYGNKAPIIRLKYSADGKKCMYIAVNPGAGLNVGEWDFRINDTSWQSTVKLIGSWPEMGYIDTTFV